MAWVNPLWRLTSAGSTARIYASADSYWHSGTEDAVMHILGDIESTVHDLGTPSPLRTIAGLVRGRGNMDRFMSMVGKNCLLNGPYDSDVDVRLVQLARPKSVTNLADISIGYWQVSLELMKR